MKKRILFLCTGNSARSQMAEAILRDRTRGEIEVRSAGTNPTEVKPMAIRALREIDIDTSGLLSESVGKYMEDDFDYVITLCDHAAENCPFFPGDVTRLHWGFEDPAAIEDGTERLNKFREIRDKIAEKIDAWLVEIDQ